MQDDPKPVRMDGAASPKKSAPAMVRTATPGVFKRANRYVVTWREGGKLRKEYFPTEKEAIRAKKARDAGYERKQFSAERFSGYAERWLATYNGRDEEGIADSTREDYRRSIEKWAIPYFGRKRMRDIGSPDVRDFIAHMREKGVRPPSVHKNLVPLKALFATAKRDGVVPYNPTTDFKIKRQKPQSRAFTDGELAALFAVLPDEWRPFFGFLLETGLRISEALGLIWSDLDLGAEPMVMVRHQLARDGKSRVSLKTENSRRDLPLTEGAARALRELRAKRYVGEDAPVFANSVGGFTSVHNLRNRVLNPALKAVKLDGQRLSFHAFRHTCGSIIFESPDQQGKHVSSWLGHSSVRFTEDTYVHLRKGNRAATAVFEERRAGLGI